MRHEEASALIRQGVAPGGAWAELGAGSGRFTRALAELVGAGGSVYAVDRDEASVRELRELSREVGAQVHVQRGDFTQPLGLPELHGILMANALHFVPAREQEAVLRQIVAALRVGGSLVMVEYDRTDGNRWVPHPVGIGRFRMLADAVGLSGIVEIARRKSDFGREMYAGAGQRRR